MWAARVRPWRPGNPHGSRLGYLPWLISCGLFRLNPRAWGDPLTIPTTTKRSYHHLEILKHQHHNKKYNTDNNNYNNNFQDTVSATHTQERSIFFPAPIEVAFNTNSPRFFSSSNPSQPNHSSLLRSTRCGIPLDPWFIRT